MYGLETAQLNDSHIKRLQTFQLKGYRKILGYKTTYGWAQQGKTVRDDEFRKIEDIMKEINEIMDTKQTKKHNHSWEHFTKPQNTKGLRGS